MKFRFRFVLFFLACFSSGFLYSADYYVSVEGDDGNSGVSVSESFRTISKAATLAGAGDVVTVFGGEYSERVFFTNSGRADAPIRFFAAKGERVVINGSGLKGLAKDEGVFQIQGASFVVIEGFEFSSSPASGVAVCGGASFIKIVNNYFIGGFGWSPIKACFNSKVFGLSIVGNVIYRAQPLVCPFPGDAACWAEMISLSNVRNAVVRGNYIFYNYLGEGIDIKDDSRMVGIFDNIVSRTSSNAIYLDARGVVEKVVVLGNFVGNVSGNGIVLANESWTFGAALIRNVFVSSNSVHSVKKIALGVGWYTHDSLRGNLGRIFDVSVVNNVASDSVAGIVGCNHSYKIKKGVFSVYGITWVNNVNFDADFCDQFLGRDCLANCLLRPVEYSIKTFFDDYYMATGFLLFNEFF